MNEMQLLVEHGAALSQQAVNLGEESAQVIEVHDHLIGVDDIERLIVLVVLPVAFDDRDVRVMTGNPFVGGAFLE